MSWREQILAEARALGRVTHDAPLGVGIDFGDGGDVFWTLPGEVTSTVPAPAEGPGSVAEILDEYRRIDHLRARALHVLSHHLADLGIRVNRRRGGTGRCFRATSRRRSS